GVLILGESGTGKEVLARFVHGASRRRGGPWVALNCAALPEDLLEAELFGIERGVATGVEARAGKFELADGGTLFLDEIGDMAPAIQAKLLRVLQEGEVYRLGGRNPRPARVRVISATNQDLRRAIADGGFRLDLFHRIADCTLRLPPLRDRRADLGNLAAFFLVRKASEAGVATRGLSKAALECLLRYPWPGNIRQLEREMGRAALFLEDGELLQTRHLQAEVRGPVPGAGAGPGGSLKEQLESFERGVIVEALARHDGQARAAAEALGVSRTTFYRRLQELEIQT
ncbi:MAG: sigma 54-interacting transcriptional regulator, partial [Acidobacteriota bacterium]